MAENDSTAVADPVEALGAAVRDALSGLTTAVESIRESNRELVDAVRESRPAATLEEGEPPRSAALLPGGGVNPTDRVRDEYEQRWCDPEAPAEARTRTLRANLELVGMIFEGAHRLSRQPLDLRMSEGLERVWRHFVVETGPRLQIADVRTGEVVRAMDTAESGFGQQLIGAQYVGELWRAARNLDGLTQSIRQFNQTDATTYVPIDGSLPEMLLVPENTGPTDSPYPTSKTGSNRRQFDPKKFTIQQIWSAELGEDSIIEFVPFLREKLAMSAALHMGSAMYNGDLTNAATGNINSDDADPADTRHYLAFDGIRHYWLVDDTGNEVNAAGAIDAAKVLDARGKMAGANNSVNALDNINWAQDARSLRIVCDWATYMKLIQLDEVITVDKYGDRATVVVGELGSFLGIPIIVPAYATKTEADGKLSATASNNTLGQLTVLNPAGWLRGVRRDVQLFFDRIQGRDQFLFELYTRVSFNRWGADVAAGVRNITV
jgi:HK97 family phage major capsid protein